MKRVISLVLAVVLMLSLSTVAFAGYKPSVEKQGCPGALWQDDLFGVGKGSIIIYDDWDLDEEEWDIIYQVPPEELVLYSVNYLSKEGLEGYRKLANAKSLTDVCANFEEVLADIDPDAKVSDMVVRDVFEFELLSGSLKALLRDVMNFIIIAFQFAIKEGDTFMCLQYIDGEWTALERESIRVKDGLVALRLRDIGTLAFVVKATK